MITIFYASTRVVQNNENGFLPYIREERKEKIARCTPQDRFRMMTADLLLYVGLQQLGVAPKEQKYQVNSYGKRELLHDKFHVNISHTKDLAVVAVATKPVGIDIEVPVERFEGLRRNGKIDKILKKIATSQELKEWETLLTEEQCDYFGKLWTRKESFVKRVGQGLSYGLSEVDTSEEGIFRDFSIGEYKGCVCMESVRDESIAIIDLEEAIKCLMN